MPQATDGPAGPLNRLKYWIALTCLEERERIGATQAQVGFLAGVDHSVISKFEHDDTWPRKTDGVVAAYAELAGIEDGRDLWERALDKWRAQGERPTLEDLDPKTPAARVRDLVRGQAERERQRSQQARQRKREGKDATRSKRATGE